MNDNIHRFNQTISEAVVSNISDVFVYHFDNIDFKTVKFIGGNKFNCVIVDRDIALKNTIIDFRAENSIVYLKSGAVRCNLLLGYGSLVFIDSDTSFTNAGNIIAAEGFDVFIGKDCMFAENVTISNTDGHPIWSSEGNRINEGGDIIIGEHVWIGRNSDILKGVTLDSGCIIGSRSVVTKDVPYASIAVGSPAKVKMNDICFSKETTVRRQKLKFDSKSSYFPKKLKNNEKDFMSLMKNYIYKLNGIEQP